MHIYLFRTADLDLTVYPIKNIIKKTLLKFALR